MARSARRDERLTFQRPLREWLRPVARASEGAAEECRSEARNALTQMPSRSMKVRSRSATNDSALQRPLRERNPK